MNPPPMEANNIPSPPEVNNTFKDFLHVLTLPDLDHFLQTQDWADGSVDDNLAVNVQDVSVVEGDNLPEGIFL